jgi:hypothetical protein
MDRFGEPAGIEIGIIIRVSDDLTRGSVQHDVPSATFAHVFFSQDKVLDLTFILGISKEINRLLAAAIIKNQQVIGEIGICPDGTQAGLQNIQGLGVKTTQKGDVVEDSHSDALRLGNLFYKLSGILTFSHRDFACMK